EQEGESLRDNLLDASSRIRTFEDGAKRHRGALAEAPVWILDVLSHEWHHLGHYVVTDRVGDEGEAGSRGNRQRILVFFCRIFFLFGQGVRKDGNQELECSSDVIGARIGRFLLFVNLLEEHYFLVADGTPELDGLLSNRFLILPHRLQGDLK